MAENQPLKTTHAPGAVLDVKVKIPPVNTGVEVAVSEKNEQNPQSYFWDNFADTARYYTPAFIVNNSGRITAGLQLVANGLSVYSGHRFYKNKSLTAYGAIDMAMCLNGLIFNERPQTREELDSYKEMNIGQYAANRVGESLQFWKYPTRSRSFVQVGTGILQAYGGMQVGGTLLQAKGLLGTAGSATLNMVPDKERAWQLSSPLFWARAASSAGNAWQAAFVGYEKNGVRIPKGNWAEPTKWTLNQLGQLVGFLYGGVYKDENGKIHKESDSMRDEFRESLEKRDALIDVPGFDKVPSHALLDSDEEIPKPHVKEGQLEQETVKRLPSAEVRAS